MGNHMCIALVWDDSFIVLLMYFIMNQNSLELSWIATRQQTPFLNLPQVFEHRGCSQGVKQDESDTAGFFTKTQLHEMEKQNNSFKLWNRQKSFESPSHASLLLCWYVAFHSDY